MKIAVLTSGGDAPGMNAALRSVVRSAISENMEVIGVLNGYQGLVEKNFTPLNLRDVANIIQRGGTVLKTCRYKDFLKKEVRQKALENLKLEGVEGLVCIGGDGSFQGACKLSEEGDILVAGIPATIDNDIYKTDFTIGFDTALNTALQAIDRIRDTAESHERLFLIEVMGKNSDFLSLHVGLASGAEDVVLAGQTDFSSVLNHLKESEKKGKKSRFIIVSEGEKKGRVYEVAKTIEDKLHIKCRVCILGHIQRGGTPSAFDRRLASQMGDCAVKALKEKQNCKLVSMYNNELVLTDLKEVVKHKKPSPEGLHKLICKLAN